MLTNRIPSLVASALVIATSALTSCQRNAVSPAEPAAKGHEATDLSFLNVWLTDFDKAKAVAAEQDRDILVNFSGSDWCGWCIRLDEEVFSKKEFVQAAARDFVLVVLDFPQQPENLTKIPPEQQRRNEALREEMNITGFPSVLLMDSEGAPYAKTGYQPGGLTNYLRSITDFRAEKARKGELVKALAETAPTGLARALLLHAIIEATPPDMAMQQHLNDMQTIMNIDSNDVLRLRSAYLLKLRTFEAEKAMQARDYKMAADIYKAIISELKPTGQELQDLWLSAGAPQFYMNDMDALRQCLDKAIAAAPTGERVEDIKAMVKRFFPDEAPSEEDQPPEEGIVPEK